jgi:hypothetical protein
MNWMLHQCDVCMILDGDDAAKLCFYCPTCDAWICQKDQNEWGRRMRAAMLAKMIPGCC